MEICVINGRSYNVHILSIERNYNILYSDNTGRTLSSGAPLILDPLGTFYGHKVTFARKRDDVKEFDELWECLSQPRRDGINIKIVYNQTMIEYEAYCSSGTQPLKKVTKDGVMFWGTLTANFIPMKAQVEA